VSLRFSVVKVQHPLVSKSDVAGEQSECEAAQHEFSEGESELNIVVFTETPHTSQLLMIIVAPVLPISKAITRNPDNIDNMILPLFTMRKYIHYYITIL
jgi:hypothetical protein